MSSSEFNPTREILIAESKNSRIWINHASNFPSPEGLFKSFSENFDLKHMTNEKRIKELFHGRFISKTLIEVLSGQDPGWLPIGENGKPSLPENIRASLTHSGPWVATWVELKHDSKSRFLGIDLQTWIKEEDLRLLEEGFRRRSFEMPTGLLSFEPAQRITIVFSILETIQKILGNANAPFIPISKLNLLVEKNTWTLLDLPTFKISGFFETHSDYVLAFGST